MIERITTVNNQQRYNTSLNFNSRSTFDKNRPTFMSYRNHCEKSPEKNTKIYSALGSIIGTALPLAALAAKRKCNPLNIEYGLGELITVGLGSIMGGIAGGSIGATDKERSKKAKEGVFQLLNMALPATLVTVAVAGCKKVKSLNNTWGKIGATIVGMGVGIPAGVKLSNLLVDPHDKEPDRKLCVKDAIANLDDAAGILVLADIKAAKKLKLERVIPFISAYCGYRAGNCN